MNRGDLLCIFRGVMAQACQAGDETDLSDLSIRVLIVFAAHTSELQILQRTGLHGQLVQLQALSSII